MAGSETFYLPLAPPEEPSIKNPPAELTEVEVDMWRKVHTHFAKDGYTIPGLTEKAELMEVEKFWLSYECILRYLRASKWKLDTCINRLEATLKWRRDYGIYDLITAAHVEPEAVTGKEIVLGYDLHGRPGFYMMPSRQNTNEATRQVQFAVWMLERAIDLMGPGVESIDLLINFADRAKQPSFSTGRTVLNILQDHYPERLGLALIINVPLLVTTFFKLITPFIDPVTRNKMKFNPQVVQDGIFAPEMVMSEWWGGSCNFEYDHSKYWPALVKMCEEKSELYRERWRKLGGTVGLKEWDYKSGVEEGTEPPTGQADGDLTV